MEEKIHRHMIESVIEGLKQIFFENRYADKVVEKNLKNQRQWGARDRRFFAENIYESVRWWRKYWFLLGEEPSADREKLWRFWGIHRLVKGLPLPEWSELSGLNIHQDRFSAAESDIAIRESIPDWLNEKGMSEMGHQWSVIMKSLNQSATVDLRVNPLRNTRKQVQADLSYDKIETDFIEGLEFGLSLRDRRNVFVTKNYANGDFEVQDRASQLVAPLLKVEPGQRVIDACAGAGGKSLHLAQLMKNKGKLISLDIHDHKLKELRIRATRNKIDMIETKLIDSNKVIKRLEGSADRVLLDVPCTGLGVIRRNPDTKWKLTAEEVQNLLKLQREILEGYASMTKVGGKLVYATCSFFPSENEKQIDAFLEKNSDKWVVEESVRINPDQGRGDGFFAARLARK
jgi:16S rRNA (cytosine967-C5)-methyltransferase